MMRSLCWFLQEHNESDSNVLYRKTTQVWTWVTALPKWILVVMTLVPLVLVTQLPSSVGAAVNVQMSSFSGLGRPERDVFFERSGQGGVWRPTAADAKEPSILRLPLFATTRNVAADSSAGPFEKGRALNLTLERWLGAKGMLTYDFAAGKSTVSATFSGLVPGGVYTMWYFIRISAPPLVLGVDMAGGARDGSVNVFRAAQDGNARWQVSFDWPIDKPSQDVSVGYAIAWHSDGKTYGPEPGAFGQVTHVQLLGFMPPDSVLGLGDVMTRLEQGEQRITALNSQVSTLQGQLAALQASLRDLQSQNNTILAAAIILAIIAVVSVGYAMKLRSQKTKTG